MTSRRSVRRTLVGGLAVAVAASLTTNACTTQSNSPAQQPLSDTARAEVQHALDAAVAAGTPGVQVIVTERGQDWTAVAGVGNVETGVNFPNDARVRIGSNTKAFVATVMMQLVAAGAVDLDAPVKRYLPGVVRGDGIDENRITVRNLMQHTSGLPEYLELPELDGDYEATLEKRFDTAELVHRSLTTMAAHFPPGEKAEYSNTNYLIVGMVVERVAGRSVADEITHRIIEPLGLRATYFPAPGEVDLREPHPLGYEVIDGRRTEVTRLDTSWVGPAGAMVSTGHEMNRFFTALLDGKLVQPAQLAEMQRNPLPLTNRPAGFDYGLGVAKLSVPCAQQVWGHGGSIPGFRAYDGVTADGRAVAVLANQRPTDPATTAALKHVFDTAICGAP